MRILIYRIICTVLLPCYSLTQHRLIHCSRGWDKVHDLCFKCTDKTQLWKPVTDQSVVVHIKGHQVGMKNFEDIHTNFTRVCAGDCLRAQLPLDVPSLANLCARGRISEAYSKCKLV